MQDDQGSAYLLPQSHYSHPFTRSCGSVRPLSPALTEFEMSRSSIQVPGRWGTEGPSGPRACRRVFFGGEVPHNSSRPRLMPTRLAGVEENDVRDNECLQELRFPCCHLSQVLQHLISRGPRSLGKLVHSKLSFTSEPETTT